jgi:hypothetical protein
MIPLDQQKQLYGPQKAVITPYDLVYLDLDRQVFMVRVMSEPNPTLALGAFTIKDIVTGESWVQFYRSLDPIGLN